MKKDHLPIEEVSGTVEAPSAREMIDLEVILLSSKSSFTGLSLSLEYFGPIGSAIEGDQHQR